ncbi:MAG: right-handed parallel beta-helix repeat-containing protein [Puniceicoccaceae bacterium]
MQNLRLKFLLTLGLLAGLCQMLQATTYYVDGDAGSDRQNGKAPETAWKSLKKVSKAKFKPGDSILLKRGSSFNGSIKLTESGKKDHPITISAYGEGPLPVINASGYRAGVHILNASHILVEDLEITGDGGRMVDGSPERQRSGVLVNSVKGKPVGHITIRNLYLHDIYPGVGSPHEGRNETTHLGYGVVIRGNQPAASSHFLVAGCRIERMGFKAIEMKNISQVMVLDNRMKDIGGPAIQPGEVEGLIVRGNIVDGSGAYIDPRMHGRGSGIWPWTSKRILIEKNTFMRARGKADSCGAHIDYNCSDVIVQYNLSIDNEGGFIEILGNNYNCAYRYNISINDGSRVREQNGAHQEGKILWTSGFVGRNKKKTGPFNSYIYNNTIYVGPDSRSCFSITGSTEGLLVANNIFHILGTTRDVLGDQDWRKDEIVDRIARDNVRNNVLIREDLFPESLPFESLAQIVGDVGFANPGGMKAEDYIPQNTELVRDRGIRIETLPGDDIGLWLGLEVTSDFFGNPINGLPDLGAIELPAAIN